MKRFFRSFVFLLFLFCFHHAHSQGLLVSGELTDPDGNLIGASAPFQTDVEVKLFETAQGGTPVYTETFFVSNNQEISVKNGNFSITLGAGTTNDNLNSVLASSDNLWIEVTIDGDVLSRAPVTASPYVILSPNQLQAHVNN